MQQNVGMFLRTRLFGGGRLFKHLVKSHLVKKGHMTVATLVLDAVSLSTPVFLPVGQRTIPNIFSASLGVSVPYFLFLAVMFQLLHSIMQKNHAGDSAKAAEIDYTALTDLQRSNFIEAGRPIFPYDQLKPPSLAPSFRSSTSSARSVVPQYAS